MKLKIIIPFLFAFAQAFGQFSASVPHTTSTPTGTPSTSGSRIKVELSTGRVWRWNGTAWAAYAPGITTISGLLPPAYTPTGSDNAQTVFAINAANELYAWDGSAWDCINCPDGDGSSTNELQNLSLTGQALGISSGTGVTLPVVGISAGSGIGVSSSAGVYTISNTSTAGQYYQTLRDENVGQTQRQYANFLQSGQINFTLTDDGANTETEILATVRQNSLTDFHIATDAIGTDELGIGAVISENIDQMAATSGQVLKWNGTAWLPAADATGGGVTSVAATAPTAGFTITGSPITSSGTLTFTLANDLAGVENLSGTGFAVRTAANTWINRTLVAGTNISITNPDGVSGNVTINATGGGTGTVTNSTSLVSGRVTLSSGTTSITDDGQFLYNPTTDQATIGTGTAVASLNIFPTATTGTVETVRESGSTSGNLVHTISNANNANTGANAFEQISVGGASAGDAFTQYTISGAVTTAIGVDNSDADKFKITPNAALPGATANAGIIVTTSGTPNVGINRDAPIVPLDVNGVARADQWRGPANVVSSANITFGTGAGTGPLNLSQSGYTNAFQIGFRTGTTPIANGDIFTFTYPTAFAGGVSFPVFSARTNAASATEITKFYISSAGATTFVLRANGTLSASTDYYLTFNVGGY